MASTLGKPHRMGDEASVTGRGPRDLANAISDAINAALTKGMEPDEAACIAVAVAADYARSYYGDKYLPHLAKAVMGQAGKPAPKTA